MKYCGNCCGWKEPGEFYKRKASKDGLQAFCKPCMNAYNGRNREKDPEAHRARANAWYATNKERALANVKAWKAKNPDYISRWQKANPGKVRAIGMRRHAAKFQRTPTWSEIEAITEFYEACPAGHEVDHIVPLRGKVVSGLHVLANLQYLTIHDNRTKKNKYTPEGLDRLIL